MPSATPRKKKVSNRITMNNFDPLKFRDTLRKVIATSNPQNMHALRRAYEAETRQAISVTTFQSFILRADVRIEQRWHVHIPPDELPSGTPSAAPRGSFTASEPLPGEFVPGSTPPNLPPPRPRPEGPIGGASPMAVLMGGVSQADMGAIPPDTFIPR